MLLSALRPVNAMTCRGCIDLQGKRKAFERGQRMWQSMQERPLFYKCSQPPTSKKRQVRDSRLSHLFVIGNHWAKLSTIFHSLHFRVNETIPDQMERGTGRCKWVNRALICPCKGVLTQKISSSPLSVKMENWPMARLQEHLSECLFQSSEGILATIYWVWNHFSYISRKTSSNSHLL